MLLPFIKMGSTAAIGFLAMNFPEFQTTDPGSAMLGTQRDPERLTDFVRYLARNSRRQRRFAFYLCIWVLFLCVPLYGIDRNRKLSELYHTAWTFKNGAPAEVHNLAQTTDGFLWVGSASGLFRFDGIQFQQYQPQSGQKFQQPISTLFATPDGGLWVGYWYGGVSLIKDGKVTDYGPREGLPSPPVQGFARDRRGTYWIAAGRAGLARLEGGRWKKIGADWGFTGPASDVFVDHSGTLWVATPTGVEYLREGASRFQTAAEGLQSVSKLAESPQGTLWMPETGRGVRPVPLPGIENSEIAVGSQAIAFDKQGSLWIATLGDGIVRAPYPGLLGSSTVPKTDARLERFTQQDGLTSDYVDCVLEDREGNIWFGTSGGLDEFRQAAIVSQSVPGPVRAIVPGAAGSLWVVTVAPNSVARYQHGKVNFAWRDPYIDCAYLDRQGFIWLAMPGWPVYGDIFRLDDKGLRMAGGDRSGVVYRYHTYPGEPAPSDQGRTGPPDSVQVRALDLPFHTGRRPGPEKRVTAMTRDEPGRLWVATSSGTFRIDSSRLGSLTSLESLGGPPGMAHAEFTDSAGRIWFGFKNEIAMLDGNRVRIFSGNDGVQIGAVTSIQGKGTKIWIGGEFGLEFFDGSRFQKVDPADGSAFGRVSGIVADSEGGLWFSENRGIIHISEAQLRHLGSGKVEFESFSSLDGLTAQLIRSPISPSAAQTTDGRIWFATTKGVAWIDPKRIVRNTVPPPVLIESVIANGRKYNNSTSLRLPPRIANLQIAYTATSLTIPERVRFRYKLEGQDKEWQDVGTRREAFYTNLDPGSYQFRVIACNNDGVWNETGTVLHFVVLPAFYQTVWFRILCIIAVAACLWLLYLLRLKQATAQVQQRLGARLEERVRIARELHDTLLQSFQGLLLRFQAASNLLPGRPDEAKKKLDHAIKQTSQAIVEGRGAVQGLRSSAAISNDLADAVKSVGDEISASATGTKAPDFDVIVEGEPRTLHPVARDEVYRIATEGLRNAFDHAESNRIEVEIRYDAIRLRLRIRDDGRGIDPRLLDHGGRAGHWGLQGMRERARLIGGNFEIWSHVGEGTEVELTLPASVAYDEHASRRSPSFQERNQE